MPRVTAMSTAKVPVPVVAPVPAITRGTFTTKKTEQSVFFVAYLLTYLPRKYEITAPKKPNNARLRINRPAGMPVAELRAASLNAGKSRGGGGVNVGKRVGVC